MKRDGDGGKRYRSLCWTSAVLALFLAVWELCSRLEWVNPLFIPPFTAIFAMTWQLAFTGELTHHILVSLGRALAGFSIAVLAGIPLGIILAGWSAKLRLAVEPLIEFLSHVNPFILFHIVILFLGIGELSKVVIIVWSCIWPVMFGTVSGMVHSDPLLIKDARSFGIRRLTLVIKVLLPAAAPAILAGMRLSAGYSLLFLIAAEMMGASSGLGWMIISGHDSFQNVKIFTAVAVITCLASAIDLVMRKLEQRYAYTERERSSWQRY